jgi:benzoyl-CoA reductase subunit C
MQGEKMFSKFEEILENRHEHIKHLKISKDKRVIGYLCSYVPEELLYAAGAIPVRIFSNEEVPSYGDSIMQSHYCAFARSILHQGLKGDYDYLDGLVWAYTCNTMRFAYEAWEMHGSISFSRFLYFTNHYR